MKRTHTEETKNRIRAALKGRKISTIHKAECQCAFCPTRRPTSADTNYKKGNAHRGKARPPFTTEWKQKISTARLKQVWPKKDTSIEVKLQHALATAGVTFVTHKAIKGQPDIFIEPNICVFADGDYWHSRQDVVRRDADTTSFLLQHGYVVVRLTETEINTNIEKCLQTIMKHI